MCVVFLFAIARTFDRSPPAADETAIHRVLNDQVAAWNRGDLDGFMAGYWQDENLTFTSRDKVNRGWDATRKRYLDEYWQPGRDIESRGKLSFPELQVESLGPGVALVRGQYKLTHPKGEDSGRFTLTFRKFHDGWKITSDHTSAREKKKD